MGAEQSAIEMFDVPAGSAFIVEDKGRVMTREASRRQDLTPIISRAR